MNCWQVIENFNEVIISDRLKVPGGWLLRTALFVDDNESYSHVLFIEDVQHAWTLEEKDDDWFVIESSDYYTTDRLKTPSGWVVRSIIFGEDGGGSVTQTFIRDEEHLWI